MSNKGKTLVVRVKLGDDDNTKWLWDSAAGKEINGVIVTGLSWDDLFNHECEDLSYADDEDNWAL